MERGPIPKTVYFTLTIIPEQSFCELQYIRQLAIDSKIHHQYVHLAFVFVLRYSPYCILYNVANYNQADLRKSAFVNDRSE